MSEAPINSSPDSWGEVGEVPLPTPNMRIGSGAFGEVYRWNKNGIQMAVKRIRVTDGCAADIVRETNIVSQLAHKHIIQCYGVDRNTNYVSIITDYAEGGNLADAVTRLNWEDKKRIVVEVALGLAYLHSQGIVHRDIKGPNILLTKHDEAKLCDFGIAKVISSATCASTYMQKGTQRWMAPELMRARPKYSAQSDIFALGVVMKELVDGGHAPLDYMAIMNRCIDKDPEKRPKIEEIVSGFNVVHLAHDATAGCGHGKIEQFCSNCEFREGVKFYYGMGVDINLAEAAERIRRPASMGHIEAQYLLGRIYIDGSGVLRDYVKAAEWLRKAADQGYAPAQSTLGLLYRDGAGVPQDYRRALDLSLAAANQGDNRACCNLAQMNIGGLGVAQNNDEALRWYREAEERGFALAQVNLGMLYRSGKGVEQDYEESAKFVIMAAIQGHTEAQSRLGCLYADGEGVPRDINKALEYWLKAAEKGNMDAQHNLGCSYFNGRGVRKNPSKGVMWMEKAADQGHVNARYTIELFRKALAPPQ
ncbi:hypothetical protein BGZ58_003407 [Dissophora ornata]|nr:hypothetical protein BGZ58_003407 [Dissophora ornata]